MEPTRIPFKIESAYAGCAKVDGLIVVRTETLGLEYRVSDRLFGALKSGIIKREVLTRAIEKASIAVGFSSLRSSSRRGASMPSGICVCDPTLLRLRVPWRTARRRVRRSRR
jgi:hypothetical protein